MTILCTRKWQLTVLSTEGWALGPPITRWQSIFTSAPKGVDSYFNRHYLQYQFAPILHNTVDLRDVWELRLLHTCVVCYRSRCLWKPKSTTYKLKARETTNRCTLQDWVWLKISKWVAAYFLASLNVLQVGTINYIEQPWTAAWAHQYNTLNDDGSLILSWRSFHKESYGRHRLARISLCSQSIVGT